MRGGDLVDCSGDRIHGLRYNEVRLQMIHDFDLDLLLPTCHLHNDRPFRRVICAFGSRLDHAHAYGPVVATRLFNKFLCQSQSPIVLSPAYHSQAPTMHAKVLCKSIAEADKSNRSEHQSYKHDLAEQRSIGDQHDVDISVHD